MRGVIVIAVADIRVQGCTDSCEPGPFYTKEFPEIPSGSSLAKEGTVGEPMYFSATIKNTKGEPIKGVKVEVVSIIIGFLYCPTQIRSYSPLLITTVASGWRWYI